jgi:hypothetical protein
MPEDRVEIFAGLDCAKILKVNRVKSVILKNILLNLSSNQMLLNRLQAN